MAVSGKKHQGYTDSLSAGSTEQFDVVCEACIYVGKTAEARGFCVTCQENLCKPCFDAHKGTKATRHHQVLDNTQKISKKPSTIADVSKTCTEICTIHQNEIIKFFCVSHEIVGCSDCITLDHRTCKIEYIPDICDGVTNSVELHRILRELSIKIQDAKHSIKRADTLKADSASNVAHIVKEIEKYQKEINDRLERLKTELVKEAQSIEFQRDKEINQLSGSWSQFSIELNQILARLQHCQVKKLDAQAIIMMKQAQLKLKSSNRTNFGHELSKYNSSIVFEPNENIETALAGGLGKLSLPVVKDPVRNKLKIDSESELRDSVLNARRLKKKGTLTILDIEKYCVTKE